MSTPGFPQHEGIKMIFPRLQMPNKIATKEELGLLWQHMPDSLLLNIFSFLTPRGLLNCSQVWAEKERL